MPGHHGPRAAGGLRTLNLTGLQHFLEVTDFWEGGRGSQASRRAETSMVARACPYLKLTQTSSAGPCRTSHPACKLGKIVFGLLGRIWALRVGKSHRAFSGHGSENTQLDLGTPRSFLFQSWGPRAGGGKAKFSLDEPMILSVCPHTKRGSEVPHLGFWPRVRQQADRALPWVS